MEPRTPQAKAPAGTGGREGVIGAPVTFRHGVASGDPLADRVILWTRVTLAGVSSVNVSYAVASDPFMGQIVSAGEVAVGPETDFTVKVDVTGLSPQTTYYYQFQAEGVSSAIGRTRTLPVGAVDRVRIGVASCSSFARGYFNAYRCLAERADLDCVVHLGDYIYEYAGNEYADVRAHEPPRETITLEDYRTRHAQYKTDLDLQEMHRQHPVIAMWDDHETADGAWRGGADNHQPETEGPWRDRVAGALRAYHEWMPTRLADPTRPEKYYREFAFGNLARLIMLEERLGYRDPPNKTAADTSSQFLGTEQEQWLTEQLRRQDTQWKVIGQGVMMSQFRFMPGSNEVSGSRYMNADQWDGYNPARERLFHTLSGDAEHAAIDNVVVLSGDVHSSWASDLTFDPGNPHVEHGGYDPSTGDGSLAVEFTCTSVTSLALQGLPLVADMALAINPQFKYSNITERGYLLIDIDSDRVSAEWWYVEGVRRRTSSETFGAAYQTRSGRNRLEPGQRSSPRKAPPPAPK